MKRGKRGRERACGAIRSWRWCYGGRGAFFLLRAVVAAALRTQPPWPNVPDTLLFHFTPVANAKHFLHVCCKGGEKAVQKKKKNAEAPGARKCSTPAKAAVFQLRGRVGNIRDDGEDNGRTRRKETARGWGGGVGHKGAQRQHQQPHTPGCPHHWAPPNTSASRPHRALPPPPPPPSLANVLVGLRREQARAALGVDKQRVDLVQVALSHRLAAVGRRD